MNNFVYHNPTKLVFGKGQIARLAKLIPAGKKIMITFGGGSVRRNGIYDQVVKALEGRDWVEFWGIEPNPSVETVREAIALGREHGSEFLLAVGGGSVIDGTKLIAAGLLYDGDPWEIVLKGQADKTVPLGTVLTMSATGSEMNNGSVISCHETKEKFPFNGDYPLFSILDPEALFSLPQKQIAYGLADTYVHVLEQYMTTPGQSRLMDRWAEGILHTVIEIAPRIRENQHDYAVMSEYMLAATLALNDMIRMGVAQDWATHMIGHELTALHGLTHGATLAIVINGTLRVLRGQKRGKLLQYGVSPTVPTRSVSSGRLQPTRSSSVPWGFRRIFRRRASARLRSPKSNAASMLRAAGSARRAMSTGRWRAGFWKPACSLSPRPSVSMKKSPPRRLGGDYRILLNRYSASRISRILMAAVAIGVPGPKMAAAPSRYSSS